MPRWAPTSSSTAGTRPTRSGRSLLPGLTDTVIEAARASGATVVRAANIYVYGGGAPETLGPDTQHAAKNPLGRLRIEMEDGLRSAGIRCMLLPAGDFIDTQGSGNWFDRVLLGEARTAGSTGNPDIRGGPACSPTSAAPPWRLPNSATVPRVGEGLFPGYATLRAAN